MRWMFSRVSVGTGAKMNCRPLSPAGCRGGRLAEGTAGPAGQRPRSVSAHGVAWPRRVGGGVLPPAAAGKKGFEGLHPPYLGHGLGLYPHYILTCISTNFFQNSNSFSYFVTFRVPF